MQTVKLSDKGKKIKISKVAGEYLLISNTWLSSRISKGKAFIGAEICMWIETRWKVSALRYNALQSERHKMGNFQFPLTCWQIAKCATSLGLSLPFSKPKALHHFCQAAWPSWFKMRAKSRQPHWTHSTIRVPSAMGPTNRPKTSSVKQNRRRKPSPLKYQCKDHTYFCRKALTNTELQSCDASCLFLLFWRNGELGILKESG